MIKIWYNIGIMMVPHFFILTPIQCRAMIWIPIFFPLKDKVFRGFFDVLRAAACGYTENIAVAANIYPEGAYIASAATLWDQLSGGI